MNRFNRWVCRLFGCGEESADLPPTKSPADEVHDKIQQISEMLTECQESQNRTLAILDRRSQSREPGMPLNPMNLEGPVLGMSVQEVRDLLARHGLTLKVVEAQKP